MFATDVEYLLRDPGSNVLANRKCLITPIGITNASGGIVTVDPVMFHSDANGIFYYSNQISGVYQGDVQAPPARFTFRLYVPDTNVLIQAWDWLTAPTNRGTPAETEAWSISSSDIRYLPKPTNNATGADGEVVSKTGDNTKWVVQGAGSGINVAAGNASVTIVTNGGGSLATITANAVTNAAVIYVYGDGTAWGPSGPISTTGTRTAGIQEAIDSLPRMSDVVSGVGGGKLIFGAGTYRCTTNIVIPNYFPYCLRMEGAGFNGTIVQGEGFNSCTNTPFFSCATNHINGLSLTNGLTLFVSDMGFCHTNQTQTNFLWDITGQTFAKFEDCMFTTTYALQNGNGGYSLNYEGNVPIVPIGLVGLAASKSGDGANAQIYLEHCLFYGLANGTIITPVIGRIRNSYFADCGMYSPDAFTRYMHTNLWKGSSINYRGSLSSGAAIVVMAGDVNITVDNNVFFNCGAVAAVGLDAGAAPGGHTIKFRDNYCVSETPSFRFLLADSMSVTCWEDIEGVDFIGPTTAFAQPDSLCTNGPAGNPVLQPNGTQPSVPVPTFRLVHSGTSLDNDSYFLLDGSGGNNAPRLIANGSGITNADASNLFGSGTVPPARLGSGSSITTKFLRGDSTWQTVSSGSGGGPDTYNAHQFSTNQTANQLDIINAPMLTNMYLAGFGGSALYWTNAGGGASAILGAVSNQYGTGLKLNVKSLSNPFMQIVPGDSSDIVFGDNSFVSDNLTGGNGIWGAGSSGITNTTKSNILGGTGNSISNLSSYCTILGGQGNLIAGATLGENYSLAWGRSTRVSVDYGAALGRRAKSDHQGSWVITDSQDADQLSSTTDELTLRFQGGVRILGGGLTNTTSAGITYNALKSPTNSSYAPDFYLGNSETNIGAAYTLNTPLHADTTRAYGQTTVFIIRTNGSGTSPFLLTAPAPAKSTGTPYVTNTTIVTVYAYGLEFTNYNFNPIY